MAHEETDVLVVGAGPTGLMMAARLHAAGVQCRVIDRSAVRSDKSRALVVHARSLELLQRLGVAEQIIAKGERAIRVLGYVNRAPSPALAIELGDIGVDDTPFPFLLFVSQAETERLLEDHIESLGLRVERPFALESFVQDETGLTAVVASDGGPHTTLRAKYIVGCDGAHSAVRRAAELSFEGGTYPADFILADVVIDWDPGERALRFFLSDEGLLAVFPFRDGGMYRIIASRAKELGDDEAPTLQDFQEFFDRVSPIEGRLRDPSWLTRFRLHHRAVQHFRRGRAFVAGDAAHVHSPAGGQGMNTGLQDADNLAWKIGLVLRHGAQDALLDSYEAERLPVARTLLRVTDRMFAFMASTNRLLLGARNLLAPRLGRLVMKNKERRRAAFRFVSQLAINVEGSPVVAEEAQGADAAFRKGPRAGHRAPDAPLEDDRGGSTRVFDVLAPAAHTLLIFTGGRVAPSGPEVDALRRVAAHGPVPVEVVVVIDPAGRDAQIASGTCGDPGARCHARYGATSGAYVLVRPDGYIGFRAFGHSAVPLADYLRRAFETEQR